MKGQSKSRSGCRVCKLKRLKCDETVPQCRNCVSRHLPCPGYGRVLKWSTKYEAGLETQLAVPAEFDALATAASLSMQESSLGHNTRQRWRMSCTAGSPTRQSKPSPTAASHDTLQVPRDASGLERCLSTAAGIQTENTTGVDRTGSGDTYTPNSSNCIANNNRPIFNTISAPTDVFTNKNSTDTSDVVVPYQGHFQELSSRPEYYPVLTSSLSDQPSYLIELWFKSVCGSWAAYDSPQNPIRRLGSSLWGSSASLYYSLQSMAAATLPPCQTRMNEVASLAPQMATRAIIQELEMLFEVPIAVSHFPTGLVISLFCMSSSLCWIDHRQLGLQYLGHARTVISLLEMRAKFLCKDDLELLEFFKGCLMYEEAIRSVVTSRGDDIRTLLEWRPSISSLAQFKLHSWTGVPPQIFGLFGKAMALCRRSRDLWRRSGMVTYKMMQDAASDIEQGEDLEEKLLSVEVPYFAKKSGDTDDHHLRSHLHFAAEAFRLSSLLQLYQSFPDLISRRLPDEVAANGSVPRSCWLTPLSLHITNILTQIPHSSGMRCLQPLLCLCAGSGLKHELTPVDERMPHRYFSIEPSQSSTYTLSVWSAPDGQSLDIFQAREVLLRRLDQLEQSLPAKPISVIQRLLGAIWQTYDNETGVGQVHWLDIMVDMNYESVFG